MKVGIVGSEAAKFTSEGEARARGLILSLLMPENAVLVSGGCHLGGIDIWAEEIADEIDCQKIIFLPKEHSWPFYKYRNLQIATTADIVIRYHRSSKGTGFLGAITATSKDM